jgi:uncharacterized protein (TIGR03118 family)
MFAVFFPMGLRSKRRPPASCHLVRPALEQLEDRCVPAGAYLQTNLVSDQAGMAAHTDPNLVNPWGISLAPSGPFWIADNGTGVSTLYDGTGATQAPPVVTIPTRAGGTAPSTPTGTVFNGSADFVVGTGATAGPAEFLFDTEDGTISGWNPSASATSAILEVDNSASGAVYFGLAIGNNSTNGNLLYAPNFNTGNVDVFDKNFKAVNLGANAFKDPTLPAGFAPFGIQNIGGNLFVTYAKQDATKQADVAGAGNGFVDVFDTSGNFVRRVASGGALNSPWGLAIAPSNFGTFSNDLLVGNLGDGLINVFDPNTGAALGQVQNAQGTPIQIPGLWALTFGNGAGAGATNTLFFTSGPGHYAHGLFGSLTVTTPVSTQPDELAAYRASNGSWSLDSDSTPGFNSTTDQVFFSFSPPNVTGVAGDWTGSGNSDIGDFNNGTWHLDLNDNGVLDSGETFQFGQAGDQPVVGDWTGNGVTNIGVFRTASDGVTGEFILDTNGNHTMDSGDTTFTFGLGTDRIVIGDWNGAGKDEVGVFRDAASFNAADAGDALFSLDTNGDHVFNSGDQVFVFGLITDHLIVGDWNGAGKSEVGVYRDASSVPTTSSLFAPGTALFSLDTNGDLAFDSGDQVFQYGLTTDQFVSGHWAKTPPLQPEGTPQAQFAANGPGSGNGSPLTEAQLQPVVQQAIAALAANGANVSQLEAAQVTIGTLNDNLVGETSGNQITIDATADGWGWNTDTSGTDFTSASPYGLQATPGSAAAGEMDLLTVVEHEFGHVLGMPDVNPLTQPNSLMASTLPVGVRRSPTAVADAVFAAARPSPM